MPIRVFYSWQNDANPKTNRYFVRDALTLAIESVANDLQLSEADRPELDHDTANVPGSPDIFSTITEKIDRCDLFVADLSLVANVTDQAGKKYPNGNVALEYGYALKRLGARRIIGVMNLEFGGIDDLPFDLKHKRAPIQYRLGSGDLAEKPTVDGQRSRLVSEVSNASRMALKEEVIPNLGQIAVPSKIQHKQNRGVYFEKDEVLAYEHSESAAQGDPVTAPIGPLMYLRIVPTVTGNELSAFEVAEANRKVLLQPFNRPEGTIAPRSLANQYGQITYFARGDSSTRSLLSLSQLFWNREIGGVNYVHLMPENKKRFECRLTLCPSARCIPRSQRR